MIPKIYHVVWLGNEMPDREKKYLENNQKILKDYNFYLWNNTSYKKLTKNKPLYNFVEWAIENKKFAFASDVIKLYAIKKFGGWALDADNEVLKTFDDFLEYSWVSGFEKYNGRLSPITAVWGSTPEHLFTDLLLHYYLDKSYEKIVSVPNTKWISKILVENGIVNDNTKQKLNDLNVTIFPDYVFCGPLVENLTHSLHHFKGSWL